MYSPIFGKLKFLYASHRFFFFFLGGGGGGWVNFGFLVVWGGFLEGGKKIFIVFKVFTASKKKKKKKKKGELALYSPSTNNALNVGASQAGTCPVFASQIISFTAMQRYRQKKGLFGCDLQANCP